MNKPTFTAVAVITGFAAYFALAATIQDYKIPGGLQMSGQTSRLAVVAQTLQFNGTNIPLLDTSGGGGSQTGSVITNGTGANGDVMAFGASGTNAAKATSGNIQVALGQVYQASNITLTAVGVAGTNGLLGQIGGQSTNPALSVLSASGTNGFLGKIGGQPTNVSLSRLAASGTNGFLGQIGGQPTNATLQILSLQSTDNANRLTNWGNVDPDGLPDVGFYSGNPKLVQNYLAPYPVRGKMLVPQPSQLSFDPGFNVYKQLDGNFTTDLDFKGRFRPPSTSSNYWVDYENGNDANDGKTAAAPKKTLDSMLVDLGVSWPSWATIWVSSNNYPFGFGGEPIKGNLAVICTNGHAIMSGFHAGQEYTTSIGVNTYGKVGGFSTNVTVYDCSTQNFWGLPVQLTAVDTTNDCVLNPGTWSTAPGGVTAIHTWNNRVPDANVVVGTPVAAASNAINVDQAPDGSQIYIENCWVVGSVCSVYKNNNTNRVTYAGLNDRYLFSTSTVSNNFHWNGPGWVYHLNSEASGGGRDGFNYHNLTLGAALPLKFVEIDCRAFTNGIAGGGNNNGTTSHDGDLGVRVNGVYLGNADRDVHDVNQSTVTWNVGCIAGQGYRVVDATNQVAWACGLNGDATEDTVMLLDTCFADQSATHFASLGTNTLILLHNTITNGTALINGDKFGTYKY